MHPQVLLLAVLAAAPRPDPAPGDTLPEWRLNGELAFTDVSGNKSLSLLTTGLEAVRSGGRVVAFTGKGEVRYGRSDGAVAVETYSGSLDARFLPTGTVSPYLTATVVRDRVRNVDVRVAAVIGAAVNLHERGENRVALGLGVLQDYEARDLPPGSTEPAEISRTRFNLRLNATTTFRRGVVAEHESMLEPVADDFGDYLFASKTSIRVLLSSRLAFQTSYVYHRDATPPPGVRFKDDRTLTAGLIIEIR